MGMDFDQDLRLHGADDVRQLSDGVRGIPFGNLARRIDHGPHNKPTRIPEIPPTTLNTLVSIRNCRTISARLAPSARRPRSRVSFGHGGHMMFMIPIHRPNARWQRSSPIKTMKHGLCRSSLFKQFEWIRRPQCLPCDCDAPSPAQSKPPYVDVEIRY